MRNITTTKPLSRRSPKISMSPLSFCPFVLGPTGPSLELGAPLFRLSLGSLGGRESIAIFSVLNERNGVDGFGYDDRIDCRVHGSGREQRERKVSGQRILQRCVEPSFDFSQSEGLVNKKSYTVVIHQ